MIELYWIVHLVGNMMFKPWKYYETKLIVIDHRNCWIIKAAIKEIRDDRDN